MSILKDAKNELGQSFGDVLAEAMRNNIAECEDPKNRIISACEFGTANGVTSMWIRSDVDSFAEDEKLLFSYNANEFDFTDQNFIGKSEEDALILFHTTKMAYHMSQVEECKKYLESKVSNFTITEIPVITECRIVTNRHMEEVRIKTSTDPEEVVLFTYFSDELSFSESTFLGKTKEEALKIYHKADVAYLRR